MYIKYKKVTKVTLIWLLYSVTLYSPSYNL